MRVFGSKLFNGFKRAVRGAVVNEDNLVFRCLQGFSGNIFDCFDQGLIKNRQIFFFIVERNDKRNQIHQMPRNNANSIS